MDLAKLLVRVYLNKALNHLKSFFLLMYALSPPPLSPPPHVPCISDVEVVKRDVLDDLLAFVDVPLGNGHILLGLKVVLGGEGVTTALYNKMTRGELDTLGKQYVPTYIKRLGSSKRKKIISIY